VVGEEKTYLLAWTTTPWTLPGNVALAVGEDVDYVQVEEHGEKLWLALSRLGTLLPHANVLQEKKGKDLIGLSYEPLFPYLADSISGPEKEKMQNAYKVYTANFVTTEDGTGIVHTAVMYGPDDFELGTKVGLPKYHLVGEDGKFVAKTGIFEGRAVRDEAVAVDVIKYLADPSRNLLFKKESVTHAYPHCWRCHTALIYYARDSWYIKMSSLRDDLVKENQKINWVPEHIRDGRFGEWLREVKDWAFSRDRYWGTPLPLWQCSECHTTEAIGSIAQLKERITTRGNTFVFARHGGADNNKLNVASATPDTPHHLTDEGKKQIHANAKKLKGTGIAHIYTSPFVRTRETAEIFAQELGLPSSKITVDERLGELRYGDFNGKPHTEFLAYRDAHMTRYEVSVPNGESIRDVKRRFASFLYDVDAHHTNEQILVVTHGVAFEVVPAIVDGLDDAQAQKVREITEAKIAEMQTFSFVPLPKNADFDIDLHKPYIDEVAIMCPKCTKPMKRTPEVADVWFDSGSMPFAQDHYPFEAKKGWFGAKQKLAYPADYISEAIDQTRGWFYTLHAVGTLMGKGRAYENVICLGHILDAAGKKMSKSIGNVINPWEMIAKYGVDVLRFWMFSVNQPGDTKNFDEKTVDEVNKKVFNILRNVVSFYLLYADKLQTTDREPKSSTHVLDRWILARLDEVIALVTKELDLYHTFEPTRALKDFVNDLSTWYIRRSRDRFKEDSDDTQQALVTTRHILLKLAKLFAPFTPFFAEEMYTAVSGEKESVHLEIWPMTSSRQLVLGSRQKTILSEMEEVRSIVSKALEARSAAGVKVRQPLASLSLGGTHEMLKGKEGLLALIRDEVNVKEIVFSGDSGLDLTLDTTITDALRKEGDVRELIRAIQDFRKESGLTASDRPKLHVMTNATNKELIDASKDQIMKATNLANLSVVIGDGGENPYSFNLE
jgi:isoleucyl-tRNA synthetase